MIELDHHGVLFLHYSVLLAHSQRRPNSITSNFLLDLYNDLHVLFIDLLHKLSSFGFAAFLIGVGNISGGLFALKSGGLIVAGVTLLIIFSVLQLKSDRPMLNLRVFRYPVFTISIILSLCLYLISMGSAIILPIFAKTLCGFSDTAYGLATIVGSVLSVAVSLYSGRVYDKWGIKPMFAAGTGAIYAVRGAWLLFYPKHIHHIYCCCVRLADNTDVFTELTGGQQWP